MPYKRKRTTRRRHLQKKRRLTRRRARGRTYNVRYGGLLGIEKKYYDLDGTQAIVTNTQCIVPNTGTTCINSPAQGDGASDRDGNRIIVKSFSMRIAIKEGSATANTVLPVFRV